MFTCALVRRLHGGCRPSRIRNGGAKVMIFRHLTKFFTTAFTKNRMKSSKGSRRKSKKTMGLLYIVTYNHDLMPIERVWQDYVQLKRTDKVEAIAIRAQGWFVMACDKRKGTHIARKAFRRLENRWVQP